MKFNQIIKILILITIVVKSVSSLHTLSENENNAAITILLAYLNINTMDPCSKEEYFTCVVEDEDDPNSLSYVDKLNIYQFELEIISIDAEQFYAFTKIGQLSIGYGFTVPSGFFSQLSSFTRITELYVDYNDDEVEEYFYIPPTLTTFVSGGWNTPFGLQWFNSSIKMLNIQYSDSRNYLMVNSLPEGITYNLTSFVGPISTVHGLPSNFAKVLQNLESLVLNVDNQPTAPGDGGEFLIFPDLTGSNVKELSILFTSTGEESSHFIEFPSSFESLENLNFLTINGYGFNLSSKGYIDLTASKSNGLIVELNNEGCVLEQCTSKPCLKVNGNTTLKFAGSIVKLNIFDLFNVTTLSFVQSSISIQTLPNTLDYSKVILTIQSTGFNGEIPSEYCQFASLSNIELQANQLQDLPGCFRCLGGQNAAFLLPNPFYQFDKNTPPDCSTFYINPAILIAKTDGTSKFSINGTDFGWSVDKLQNHNGPDFEIVKPNKELSVSIPPGEGSSNSFIYYFNNNTNTNYTFTFKYEVPVVKSYSVVNIDGVEIFVISGTGFSFINSNKVYIDNVLYTASIANVASGGNITINSNPIKNIITGSFKLSVTVGDQTSVVQTYSIPIPPTSSPTTSPSNSEESDEPSSTIKLTSSFYLLCITQLLISLSLF